MGVIINRVGKFLRVIRISHNESARDMAEKLQISPSYLSAIENGKRSLPENFEELVINCYDLTSDELQEFRDAVNEVQGYLKVNTGDMGEDEKYLIMNLLNNKLDDSTIEKLCGIIKSKKEK